MGYDNIQTGWGRDVGLAEEMPFEAIIVTAGAPRFPALTEQLALGGRW